MFVDRSRPNVHVVPLLMTLENVRKCWHKDPIVSLTVNISATKSWQTKIFCLDTTVSCVQRLPHNTILNCVKNIKDQWHIWEGVRGFFFLSIFPPKHTIEGHLFRNMHPSITIHLSLTLWHFFESLMYFLSLKWLSILQTVINYSPHSPRQAVVNYDLTYFQTN